MGKVNYSVEYYEENGKSPVLEFYRSLSEKEVAKEIHSVAWPKKENNENTRTDIDVSLERLRKYKGLNSNESR